MQRTGCALDRTVRTAGWTRLLAVAFAACVDGKRTRAAMAAVTGLIWDAATRFCRGNSLLGIDPTGGACSTE